MDLSFSATPLLNILFLVVPLFWLGNGDPNSADIELEDLLILPDTNGEVFESPVDSDPRRSFSSDIVPLFDQSVAQFANMASQMNEG